MFPALPENVQQELAELAERFGQPKIYTARLPTSGAFDPLDANDRYSEVCMVIRRPDGRLLTAKKTFYPDRAYRLLTGGIEKGEPVLEALLREVEEETALDVVVRRFLAAVAYQVPERVHPVFYTFAFLLDETGGILHSQDPNEHLEYFQNIAIDELPERADFFAHLTADYNTELRGNLADWGLFRSIIHQQVWEVLKTDSF
jgi:8-oxo-dGTP pyrophosphatase MutT (NUDIX family)